MSRSTSPRKQINPKTPVHTSTRKQSIAQTTPSRFDDTDKSLPIHISPSKARADRLLNHDIDTITAWLEDVLAVESLPRHLAVWQDEVRSANSRDNLLVGNIEGSEGNNVLEALKALKQANLEADYLRGLMREAEEEELVRREGDGQCSHAAAAGLWGELNKKMVSHETAELVDNLSRAAVLLGLNETDVDAENKQPLDQTFLEVMLKSSEQNLVLSHQVRELKTMAASVRNIKVSGDELMLGQQQRETDSERLRAQTALFNHDTKQIQLRLMEQEGQLRGLERQTNGASTVRRSTQRVIDARQRVAEKRERFANLQARIAV